MTDTQYQVLLYNDDRSTMESVAEALRACIPRLSEPQAIDVMMSAHTFGMARVIVANRINATAYCQKLKDWGLTCAIAPANDTPVPDEQAINQ